MKLTSTILSAFLLAGFIALSARGGQDLPPVAKRDLQKS